MVDFYDWFRMEPDELELYIALKDLCTDIAAEIYPHYKGLYPAGVKEMTALDPELSESARAPGQQAIIRSLETYWNDNKDKLDTGRGTG